MVLYFTGTGNSKYIAERIATALNEDILSMNDRIKEGNTANVMTGKSMVIVVPTYAWRIPRIVLKWLQQTKFPEAKKIWFVMDCGGEIGNAAKYNQELSRQLHLSYMGTAQIVMPENYIAMFGVPGKAEAKEIVAKAEPSIDDVIKDIQAKREFSKPRNNMYDKIMSSAVNTIFYPMFVKADKFLATDACISCGKCVQVCPLNNVQLKNGNGYDHNFVLNTKGDLSTVAARLSSPESGIVLEVYTDEPGIQVYTGNFLDGTVKGKKGVVYNQRASVCLETQHFPDSPNKPRWPSVYLEPGQTYSSRCIYKFSVEK